MALEKNLPELDWKKIKWEKTPYKGVFVYLIEAVADPNNSTVPKSTLMAVRVDPTSVMPLHRHRREKGWKETLTFPTGGNFDIKSMGSIKRISGREKVVFSLAAFEAFGLKNNSSKPLFFYSKMIPGFTGYQELEEIK